MRMWIFRCVSRLRRDIHGVIAIEFALILPILVVLFLGAAEFGRLILLSQKLQNGAFVLADLIGRDERISESKIEDIFHAVGMVMKPFDFSTNGRAIVTSVGGSDDDGPLVNWQRYGAGQFDTASAVGVEGGEAAISEALTLDNGETLLVAELYFSFEPLFGLMLDPYIIRKEAYLKPRLGVLDTIDP